MAAISAAEHLSIPYKMGVIGDMASLGPESNDGFRHFLNSRTEPIRRALYEAGVLDGTGESAVLFVQCAIFGLRAGAVNICGSDQKNKRWDPSIEKNAVEVGVETMRIIAAWDKTKTARGTQYITP